MASLPQHLDLHLIRILYLLLVEKNVSRVALKLNQPQPSISASLRKLRELVRAGALSFGYYPDDFAKGHPDVAQLAAVMSLRWFPYRR